MKSRVGSLVFSLLSLVGYSQDWNGIAVPANAGTGNVWQLQTSASDDFNYMFNATSAHSNFGSNKWYNFYHNSWDGPGTTYWKRDHVSVSGGNLVLRASRNPSTVKMGVPGVNAGCITSNNKVKYPVFVEASVSVADIALASDVWLLSPDDTQEIDIIECYGGAYSGNDFFAQYIHLSHHSFVRNPFQDYQPRDQNSWWGKSGVTSWGQYCWNAGARQYVRIGVNWISPVHFEYYIDGQLVRVLYNKAFATKIGNTWYYTYPTMTNGALNFSNGYQTVVQYATGSTYSFSTLQAASNASSVSVIDPYNYQGGNGFTKELDIIINVESQDWHVAEGRTPSDAHLNDASKNQMKVNWIRVYKPVPSGGGSGVNLTIQAENFTNTGGTYNDASSGGPGFGVNRAGSIINFVNTNDWADFPVNIPETGNYSIQYFVGTAVNGAAIQILVDGVAKRTDAVPNNNNWNVMQTVNSGGTINITAGSHTIRLRGAGTNGWEWNMDKFVLSKVTSGRVAAQVNANHLLSNEEEINVYPNPVNDLLKISGLRAGPSHITVKDLNGHSLLNVSTFIDGTFELNVAEYTSGLYVLLASNGHSIQTVKFVVNH